MLLQFGSLNYTLNSPLAQASQQRDFLRSYLRTSSDSSRIHPPPLLHLRFYCHYLKASVPWKNTKFPCSPSSNSFPAQKRSFRRDREKNLANLVTHQAPFFLALSRVLLYLCACFCFPDGRTDVSPCVKIMTTYRRGLVGEKSFS